MTAPNDSGGGTVVDFSCHLYPDAIVDKSREDNPFWDHLGSIPHNGSALLARLESAGVDAAVLSMPQYMGHDDTAEVARANDALLDVVAEHDEFYGLAAVPTDAGGEAAAAELQRALAAGFHGGALETMSNGSVLTAATTRPVLEVADKWGAPLLVHPKLRAALGEHSLDETHYHNAIFGREAALGVSLTDALHAGLPERYPDLSLVFHHLGGNIASMLGRIRVHGDAPRWPFKDDLLPYSEFERRLGQVYVDTAGHFDHERAIAAAVDAFPTSNLLFGTDTPFEARSVDDIEAYSAAVRNSVPTPTAERRVMGANALDVLVNVE